MLNVSSMKPSTLVAHLPRHTTVLVTGARGFVGRHTVDRLTAAGYKVRALVPTQSTYFNDKYSLEMVEGDITNQTDLIRALKGIDVCIHLAARKSDELDSYSVNVGGAKNLIRACQKNHVKLVINISTASTKISVPGVYAATKREADSIFSKSGLSVTTLTPSIIFGELEQGLFGSLVRYSTLPITPLIGDGSQRVYPIHVDDVADMLMSCINCTNTWGKHYDLCGKTAVTLREFISQIGLHIHRKPKIIFVSIPIQIGVVLARLLSVLPRPPITQSNILGSTQTIQYEQKELWRDIHYQPHTLKHGLRQVSQEYDHHYFEATAILKYVASPYTSTVFPTHFDILSFAKVLRSRTDLLTHGNPFVSKLPWLIGPIDSVVGLVHPTAALHVKCQLAAAIAECHPGSSSWLLSPLTTIPKNLGNLMYLGLHWVAWLILGAFFFPILLVTGLYEQRI